MERIIRGRRFAAVAVDRSIGHAHNEIGPHLTGDTQGVHDAVFIGGDKADPVALVFQNQIIRLRTEIGYTSIKIDERLPLKHALRPEDGAALAIPGLFRHLPAGENVEFQIGHERPGAG